MQSIEKNISRDPTRILYFPKLPTLLANWNTLKLHFSEYGNTKIVLNPQQRSCTVSFETVADAERAKSKGCVWNHKDLFPVYVTDSPVTSREQRRSSDVLNYSELDSFWSDENLDKFGEYDDKPVIKKKKEPKRSERRIKEALGESYSDLKILPKTKIVRSPKHKLVVEKKSSKLKSSVEVKTKAIALYSDKEKHKEIKKKIKEALIKRKQAIRITENLAMCTSEPPSNTSLLSLKEKLKLLEERDKDIRKTLVKSSNLKTAKAIIGTCPDMCPEKERVMRDATHSVSVFELFPNTDRMDHTIAVKEYSRSSANQEAPLPHELRPEPVLSMTMNYLVKKIMPLIEGNVNISEWYDFCWGRLRSIRKDITQQLLCSSEIVKIIEQCARFHICCYDRLWGTDPATFDEKINSENLMHCLQTLRQMYEDLGKEGVKCLNEPEFNAYMIMFNMNTGDLMATYQQFSEELLKEEQIQNAVRLYLSLNNSMYSTFFKLVRNSSYLEACLLQRYFYHVRQNALQTIATAYCPPNKRCRIPLKQMNNLLKFDSTEDTKLFCEGHGILLEDDSYFYFNRNGFFFPESKINSLASSSLVANKRVQLIEAVAGNKQYCSLSISNHSVHSSFADDGKLHETASDVSEHDAKLTEMHVEFPDTEMAGLSSGLSDARSRDSFDLQDDRDVMDDDYEEEEEEMYEKNLMDVDNKEKNIQKKEVSFHDTSYTDRNNVSIDNYKLENNDAVTKEQQNNASFIFNLTNTKINTHDFNKSQPLTGTFIWNPTATNTFNANDQLKSNQSTFKLDFSKNNSASFAQFKRSENVFQTPNSTLKSINMVDNRQKSPKLNFPNNDESTVNSNFSFNLKEHNVKYLEKSQENYTSASCNSPLCSNTADEIDAHNNSKLYSQNLSSPVAFNKDTQSFVSPFSEEKIHNVFDSSYSGDVVDQEEVLDEAIEKHTEEDVQKQIEIEKAIEIKNQIKAKERQELKELRSRLRRRLKAVRTRYFVKKWQEKVKKIKQIRKDFPVLIGSRVDDEFWGSQFEVNSIYKRSLLSRLNDKRLTSESVDLILNTKSRNVVQYLGKQVAEVISLKNIVKLNIRDFHVPFYWKLIVSIPFMEDTFYVEKISNWLQKVFYRSENLILGSVTEEMSSQNVPVYYCVHLLVGNDFQEQKDKINGMSSLLFFSISGVENLSDKIKRFSSLMLSNACLKPTTVALVNIGKECDDSNAKLIELMKDKIISRRVTTWIDQYWNDFVSIKQVVNFFTTNVGMATDNRVCTLDTLFRRLSEHIISFLQSAQIASADVSSLLTNPNFVIGFYNSFFDQLKQFLLNSNTNLYDIVPPEFKDLVRYLNKTSRFVVCFDKSSSSEINEAFERQILPYITQWPPLDETELLDTIKLWCHAVECANILPRLVRFIDVNDDNDIADNLNKVSWIDVCDLIVRETLELFSEHNKQCIVLYDERAISNLFKIDFSFKLLLNES